MIYVILVYTICLVIAFIAFILLHAVVMGLLNTICGWASDYALTNLWN